MRSNSRKAQGSPVRIIPQIPRGATTWLGSKSLVALSALAPGAGLGSESFSRAWMKHQPSGVQVSTTATSLLSTTLCNINASIHHIRIKMSDAGTADDLFPPSPAGSTSQVDPAPAASTSGTPEPPAQSASHSASPAKEIRDPDEDEDDVGDLVS